MALYVFALVDELPAGPSGRGLSGRLGVQRVAGALAIVERRADVPPVEFGTLKTHHAVVERIAGAVPAILPVRFGTLMERDELEEALDERDEELAEAFAAVRHRVQFSWRTILRRRSMTSGYSAPPREAGSDPGSGGTGLGTAYLRRAANPPLPSVFRPVRTKLKPLVAAERYQPAAGKIADSLYHLVDRAVVARYRAASKRIAGASPVLTVSGPFAPFAFTPDLL